MEFINDAIAILRDNKSILIAILHLLYFKITQMLDETLVINIDSLILLLIFAYC